MKIQKPERLAGYILLVLGLVIVLISAITAILMVTGRLQMFQFVQKPIITGTDSDVELAKVLAETVPLLNIVPTFLLLVVLVYAGSVIMGKGVGMIKEIQWKVPKVTEKETEAEAAEEPPKKIRKQKQEEE